MKIKRIIGFVLLVLVLFAAGGYLLVSGRTFQDRTFDYKGKVIYRGFIDDQLFGNMEVELLMQYPYLLERNYKVSWSGVDSATGNVVAFKEDDPRFKILTSYYVTDMSKGMVVKIDTSQVAPVVLGNFPVSEKKDGILFMPELNGMEGHLEEFRYLRDTIINAVRNKIIVDTIPRDVGNGVTLEKTEVFASTRLKEFPLKLSTFLSDKFEGWVYYIKFWSRKGPLTTSSSFEFSLIDGFSKSEQKLMDKMISLTQRELSRKKK